MLCVHLLAQQPLAEPPRVGEVVFEGADAESVRELVDLRPGQPLGARDVRDAVRALHASAKFSRVAAYAEPPADGRRRVVFVLTPVEKLVAVSFVGNKAVAEGVLLQQVNLQVNAEFQPEQVGPAIEAVQAAYFRIGSRHAKVSPVRKAAPGGMALEFRVDEGAPTRVRQVSFEGDLGLDPDQLAAAFRIGAGDVLNVGALDEAVRRVRERYRLAGRLRARVESARVEEVSAREAQVLVPVSAGPLVRFNLRGNRAFSDTVLASHLVLDSDDPLDEQAAVELAGRLRRFYVAAGFLRARVAERGLVAPAGAQGAGVRLEGGVPGRG